MKKSTYVIFDLIDSDYLRRCATLEDEWWTSHIDNAQKFNSLDDAANALDDADCERWLRDRLVILDLENGLEIYVKEASRGQPSPPEKKGARKR